MVELYVMKKEKVNIYQAINVFLSDWNPIGVPQDISEIEYSSYVPMIVNTLSDRNQLVNCLREIVEKCGVCGVTDSELIMVADRLIRLKSSCEFGDAYFYIYNCENIKPVHTSYVTSLFRDFFNRYSSSDKYDGMKRLFNDVGMWYVHYKESAGNVLREIGVNRTDEIICKFSKATFSELFFPSGGTLLEYAKQFDLHFISKEEFEELWNSYPEIPK
ncbi:MAG: hypothetical protein K6F69_06700 [Treponema sp.]|nr:hypothetical protein [Treponema sp.]